MSEIQLGDQQTKPEDLNQKDAKIDAAIDAQVKHNMGSLSKFMGMMKSAERGFDLTGEVAKSQSPAAPATGSSFASGGSSSGRGRKKGAKSLDEMLRTTDWTGSKLSRSQIKTNYAIVESAFTGAKKKSKDGSESTSKDFHEELNLLKQRMAFLPAALKANKAMLPGYGLGYIYEAHSAVQKEKDAPCTNAVISGTMNDMEQFLARFKTIDEGVKERIYSNASAQTKQKLNPLMSGG